ncbi:MAG: SLBB domain-containing protein [Nitrospirae bacterium]|nr:SLBB domain-containing protein [Nitrospirota bacterium]
MRGDGLSQFERFVSVRAVDLDESQLKIILDFKKVAFRHAQDDVPTGKSAFIVRIIGNGTVKDLGYLIGSQEDISEAFDILGIMSPFTVSSDIRQFGYDAFGAGAAVSDASQALPAGPGYLIGPGDELRITVWGKISADASVVVDRDGMVSVPQFEVMHVAGLTFAQARKHIEDAFARYYRPSEVKVNVGMGRLRSMRVFVVGNVTVPGSYNLSSLSTVINALYASGGPSKSGSLRNIQVKRGSETVARLDLYDFLLKGDKSGDVRLMPEDVVFVPPAGPLVGVAGTVRSPAIYELEGPARVTDVIRLAGGLDGTAFGGRLRLARVEKGERRTVAEADLSDMESGSAMDFLVQDGDVVTVFPVPSRVEKEVRIAGAVMSPGTFGYRDGMKLGELLGYAGGPLRFADRANAELTRTTVTSGGPVVERMSLDLDKAASGDPEADITLMPDDYVFVKAVPEWGPTKVVSVRGQVLYPGDYTVKKDETLSSLIQRAGGFTSRAFLRGAVFTRQSVKDSQQRTLDESIDRLEQQLFATSAESVETSVTGDAYQQEKEAASLRRSFIAKLRSARASGRISMRLEPYDEFKGGQYDVTLEDGDSLVVPERPDHIQIIGSVYNQTAFVYNQDGTVGSYLKAAGGITDEADEDNMYVLKVDGTAVSKRDAGAGWFNVSFDSESHRWTGGGFSSRRLDPGDTVVVPAETEKVAWLREVKDITQILFQIAVSAGVAIAAF